MCISAVAVVAALMLQLEWLILVLQRGLLELIMQVPQMGQCL